MGKLTVFLAILSFAVVTHASFFFDNPFDGRSDPFRSVSDGNQNRFGGNDLDDIYQMQASAGDVSKSTPTTHAPTSAPTKRTRNPNRPRKYRKFDENRPYDPYVVRKKRKRIPH